MRVLSRSFLPLLALAVGCGGSSGPPTGPPAPVRDTIRVYTGRVAFFTTGPPLRRDGDGRVVPERGFVRPTFPRPAPHFPVEILDASGTVIAEGSTDATGVYSIPVNYGKNPAPAISARVRASFVLPGGTVVRVLANGSASEPYTATSPVVADPGSETVETDVTVGLDEGAGAFHILDACYAGLIAVNTAMLRVLPDLDILWEPGNGDRSFLTPGATRTELTVAGGRPGDPTSNTDVWDAPQLMRLMGAYFLASVSGAAAPPGDPGDGLLVPSLAWREGFLDFFACVLRGTPEFWDTEGSGDDGRVVRFFNVESFFDPALGSLGPDDPNVYQDPALVGIGSRFTVAEVLWDIHDGKTTDVDRDAIDEFPLLLTLRDLKALGPSSYPYLFTLLDNYVTTLSITAVKLDIVLALPEDQGLDYPPSEADGTVWPRPITNPLDPADPVVIPFDETVSDRIDTTLSPNPNGLFAQRYFIINLGEGGALHASVTAGTPLRVEILDLANRLLAAGTDDTVAMGLDAGRYVIRVLPAGGPAQTDFDLRVRLTLF